MRGSRQEKFFTVQRKEVNTTRIMFIFYFGTNKYFTYNYNILYK